LSIEQIPFAVYKKVMNIVLFEKNRNKIRITSDDHRFRHIRNVLKLAKGDSFKAGVINGKKGSAEILSLSDYEMILKTDFREDGCKPVPIELLAGHPRPPAARRIIKDCTSFSVKSISFFIAVNSEKSYMQSSLWKKEEYKKALMEGAEQGGHCFIPELNLYHSLNDYFSKNDPSGYIKICFDKAGETSDMKSFGKGRTLAVIGPERGWVDSEIELIRLNGFQFFSLGDTILRTETACTGAVSVINYINNFFRG
jgi:16S rRNA (uracil1498-N3)-methyltransferase